MKAALLLALAGCGGGGGGGDGAPVTPPPTVAFTDPLVYSNAQGGSIVDANENSSVTPGTVTVAGQALSYTATAGHLIARRLGTDAPDATMFYVAYTLNGSNPATRPVTFFYNGGPGSATVWLHMGSFGPKRLDAKAPRTDVPVPFPLVDNAESILDLTDLVFVDAVGAGYSTAVAPNTNRNFWGVDSDAAVFRDFIRRYVSVNNRGASPKFLFGESYGTTRSAVLARLMESAGIRLSGVVLQSSVLNYNSNCGLRESGQGCAGFLGTYGAVGAWFQMTSPPVNVAGLGTFAQELRGLTDNFYGPAISTFFATRAIPDPANLQVLTNATGITVARWQANFNMGPDTFRQVLRPGEILGRYDARMSATNVPAGYDISSAFIDSSFASGLSGYLTNTLRFTTPSSYTTLGNAINFWNFTHDGLSLPDAVPDLATAMTLNPRLKVLAVSGYHDLATPWFVTERDLQRLGANPNILVRNYSGGHMTYLDDATRAAQRADLVEFYRSALQ
ncbi:S10 family peptidase [Usitatibacter palustris]|uniref:S10 family peptidase n=1 Tax=Usitatibacter palustris TaxID=2732487 RepID=UPI001BB24C57|nr:hypothetical protein [Usitatibacter palustris]